MDENDQISLTNDFGKIIFNIPDLINSISIKRTLHRKRKIRNDREDALLRVFTIRKHATLKPRPLGHRQQSADDCAHSGAVFIIL